MNNHDKQNSPLNPSAKAKSEQFQISEQRRSYTPEMIVEPLPPELVEFFRDARQGTAVGEWNSEDEDDEPISIVYENCVDWMDGELPPEDILALIPEDFTEVHSIAYILLNLFQQSSSEGIANIETVVETLEHLFQMLDKNEIASTCRDVVVWTQELAPRDLKPSAYSLIWHSKLMLNEAQIMDLMGQVKTLARQNWDVCGKVGAFVEWLECFFMDKMPGIQKNSFAADGEKMQVEAIDPDWWTLNHDIATMALHFNALRDQDINDNDKFAFQLYIPEMLNIVGRGRIGNRVFLPVDIPPLLEEVDSVLFPPTGKTIVDRSRLAKSHQNLVRTVNPTGIFESEMKQILFLLYRAIQSHVYLTHDQKMEFKRWLLFWDQGMVLTNLISVVDYSYDAGREVLSAIDFPQRLGNRGRSLERFCLG